MTGIGGQFLEVFSVAGSESEGVRRQQVRFFLCLN